jgi:hypothetical protein
MVKQKGGAAWGGQWMMPKVMDSYRLVPTFPENDR